MPGIQAGFFHKISEPGDQDIAELLESIIEAVELCLRRRGLLDEQEQSEIAEDLMSIEAASRASVAQKIAFGERLGQRVRRVCFRRDGDVMEFKGPQCIALAGFSLHAARRVGSEDRRTLSQLINNMARPPLAKDRLERTATGDILYKLKEAWNDGSIGIQLSPSELIEKLIALIPPRRSPLVRYGGVFAPNFKRRDEVILAPCRHTLRFVFGGEDQDTREKFRFARTCLRRRDHHHLSEARFKKSVPVGRQARRP